jgi:ribosomal protein S1
MEKISLVKEETDAFNWDIPNGISVNEKIKTPNHIRVYSHEDYAFDLYSLYCGVSSEKIQFSKDLENGKIYKFKISSINENSALGYTESGQNIFVDLKREKKDAAKFGIEGIDFKVSSEFEAIVREIGGTYYGSVVDCFVQGVKGEFFDQLKESSVAYPARVESINRGGYLVDISGVKCFLPGSLAAANKITDFESYIGKTIYVMIDGYVAQKDIFIVSYKKYLNNIMGQKIQELDLTKKYKGCVTGSSSFGLFVEWEDVYTGLIHKTEFEDQIVQGFNPGDEIEFYVKEVKEDNKLTLTFGSPVEKTIKIYEIKDQIDNGTVEAMAAVIKYKRKNGCLVEIPEIGTMAMIPQDRLTSDLKNAKPGDRIAVLIYEVDPVMGKIFANPVDVQ